MSEKYMLYCHINKFNLKMYFGITKNDINKRYHSSHGYKGCPYFYFAIKKYGWDNFEHMVVMENLSKEDAEFYEQYFIAHFDTCNPEKGYNIQRGGKSSGEVSEEGRRRLVEAASGANSKCAKPIVVFDINGAKIEEFVTIEEAKKKYKSTIIWKNADKYSHAINGFFFRFKSLVGDSEKMDTDDLLNSPLSTPKQEIPSHSRAIAVFNRSDGSWVETVNRQLDIKLEYGQDCSKMYQKGYVLSQKYIFKYANECNGIEKLDLSFLEVDNNGKEVNQYDLNGTLVQTFCSLRKASDATGISYKSMSQCAVHKIQSSGGFVWRYVDDPVQFEKPKTCADSRKDKGKYNYKKIDQIDLKTGEVIKTFNSLTEAANSFNVSKSNIYAVAKHVKNSVSACGFGWRYHEEGVG